MGEPIRFDEISREGGIIAQRFMPGQQVILGPNALMAELTEQDFSFRCIPAWKQLEIPGGGRWYAVSLRRFILSFGVGDMISYSVDAYPGQAFRLGFFSQVDFQVAHLKGFQRWMRGRETVSCDSLATAMHGLIAEAVQLAVCSVLRPYSNFGACTRSKPQLEAAIEEVLFDILFENGLCVRPHTYRIVNFAKPTIAAIE